MPPNVMKPPLPVSLGKDAMIWLEHHGMTASTPTIRSSDWELLSDPFRYYLTRRLGLIPALSWSKALSRGSYFHIPFALFEREDKWSYYRRMLAARCQELRALCKELNVHDEASIEITAREIRDAACARSWYEATEYVRMKPSNTDSFTFQEFMRKPHWKKVGGELRIVYIHPSYQKTPFVIQLDVLLLNTKLNTLWPIDAKTTASSPLQRLFTVKHEFQTQHYMSTLHTLLQEGKLQCMLDLPPDTKLGGMIHVAVQKPTIIFGQKDRPFKWASYGKGQMTKGEIIRAPETTAADFQVAWTPIPNNEGKGTSGSDEGTLDECIHTLHSVTGKKPERVYHGEPSIDLYTSRCRQWYKDQQEANPEDPPVNMSRTQATVLESTSWRDQYRARLNEVYSYATANPHPINYPSRMDGATFFGSPSPYAMFYVSPPAQWPEIARDRNFIVRRRDEDIEGTTETVLETMKEPS